MPELEIKEGARKYSRHEERNLGPLRGLLPGAEGLRRADLVFKAGLGTGIWVSSDINRASTVPALFLELKVSL